MSRLTIESNTLESRTTTANAPAQGRRKRAGEQWHRRTASGFMWVLPLFCFIALAFDLPLLLMAGWSVVGPDSGAFTIANYYDALSSSIYSRVILRTAFVALIVSTACAVIGYPLAYWMTLLSRRGQLMALLVIVTSFWVSILVRTYAWIVVLGNAGIINRALLALGITSSPTEFLYNEFGVTVGMVNVLLPFMLLPLFTAMTQIDPRLRQMAYTLGASSGQFFWRIFFPMTLPALGATFILVFILSIGFYITPAILGGGKVPLIANMLDILINRFPQWNMAAAISIILLLLTLGLYAAYQRLRRTA